MVRRYGHSTIDKCDMLKSATKYLISALPFFDTKSRSLSIVVFLPLLAVNAAFYAFQIYPLNSEPSVRDIIALLCYVLISKTLSFVYLLGVIKDVKGEEYNSLGCVIRVVTRYISLFAVQVIKAVITIIGIILLIVPAIVASVMFSFTEAVMLDDNTTIVNAFLKSREITMGKKKQIFMIELFCGLVLSLFGGVAISVFAGNNNFVAAYVSAFLAAIITLIDTRRLALMYTDVTVALTDDGEGISVGEEERPDGVGKGSSGGGGEIRGGEGGPDGAGDMHSGKGSSGGGGDIHYSGEDKSDGKEDKRDGGEKRPDDGEDKHDSEEEMHDVGEERTGVGKERQDS